MGAMSGESDEQMVRVYNPSIIMSVEFFQVITRGPVGCGYNGSRV